jgi:hypothetical protein
MPKEQIFFHKGLAYDARRNLQQEGYLKQAVNITYGVDGEQTIRPKFTNVNTTPVGAVHSVRRFRNIIVIGDGTHLRFRSALSTGDFTDIGSGFANAIWTFREYKQFLHGVNGTDEVLIDENGNCFPATIEAPVTAPTLADSSSAGLPSGCYAGYATYEITFPNGMKYETGLSTGSGDVTVSSEKINWSAIPVSSYAAYYAAAADAFNVVKLLLHCEGLDGSTTITDSSGQHTVVASGAVIDTAQAKFGSSSIYFDGSDDFAYIDSTDANINDFYFGTGAFTIDFWVRFSSTTVAPFFQQYVDASNYVQFTLTYGTINFAMTETGKNADAVFAPWSPSTGTWYHVAVIRGWGGEANSIAITINGALVASKTFSGGSNCNTWTNMASALEIGKMSNPTLYFNGHIDEFRVSKGIARWTAAFTAPTTPGNAPAIKRKLYRGPGTTGTLGDIYYLDTVDDNTTTTYTDNSSDATIGANDASIVDDYCPAPDSHYIEYLYGRAFWIDDDHPWRLYYAEAAGGSTAEENEAIIPMATEDENWDDLRVAGFEDCDPQGLVSWGTNLYIPLRHTWIKKQGNDPDTWSYKKTWSRYGVAAPHATAICPAPAGVIFLTTPEGGECGLALFNGASAEMFTSPKLDYIFNTDLNKTYIHMCRGVCSGHYYHLLYPSGSNTDCDKWLAIDMRRFPDIRVAYWQGLSARCLYSYTQGTGLYVGTSDGYVKYLDSASTETMGCYIETHELIGGDPALANEEKVLRALHYNINTNSVNVSLAIYIDGTQATWPDGTTTKTITGSGDAVQVMRDFPPNFRGYNFRVYVYKTSGLGTFTVYSPWSLSFEAKEG